MVLGVATIAPSCAWAEDGLRLLGGGLRESTPIVKALPAAADDATLAAAAAQYLDSPEIDQTVLQRARELAGDEDAKALVKWTCNLSGVAKADPDTVVSQLQSIADSAPDNDRYGILHRDAAITAKNVQEQSGGTAVMTGSASLSVAVSQKVYC